MLKVTPRKHSRVSVSCRHKLNDKGEHVSSVLATDKTRGALSDTLKFYYQDKCKPKEMLILTSNSTTN